MENCKIMLEYVSPELKVTRIQNCDVIKTSNGSSFPKGWGGLYGDYDNGEVSNLD